MMSLEYVICFILGLALLFMGFQGTRAGWDRSVPVSYKIAYVFIYICYMIFCFNVTIGTIGPDIPLKIQIASFVLLGFLLGTTILIPNVLLSKGIRKISFKNTLLYGFASKEEKKYRKLTSKEFADQNHTDYIPSVRGNIIEKNDVERIVAMENKYIEFYPFNDGSKYSHKKEWFGRFERNGEVYYAKIMDTKKAFNSITNLKEILMQMIQLYFDNMAKDIFMDPYKFALMLEDEPKEGYCGRAKLIITANTLTNRAIEVDEKENAKKYFLNRFLDCFLGWNFGKIINDDVELQVRIKQLNDYAILKGMRSSFQKYGTNLEFNEDIQQYKLNS